MAGNQARSQQPPTLLTLPLEIRQLIFDYTLEPLIIIPPTPGLGPLSEGHIYKHPSPSNPLVYGILKGSDYTRSRRGSTRNDPKRSKPSSWRIPIAAYPVSARAKVRTHGYASRALPSVLQRTCRQLNAEVTQYALKSGIWTFAFSSFEALIKWLKGRDGKDRFGVNREDWLRWVGSVLIEINLDIILGATRSDGGAALASTTETITTDGNRPVLKPETDFIPEDQEPWLDALLLLTRLCPQIHTLGLRGELRGPEIQVMHFGFRPISWLTVAATASDGPPQDWPPGQKQPRVDFRPIIERLLSTVENLKGLRTCGIVLEPGHILRNVVGDAGDGQGWARSWEPAQLDYELQRRVAALERGLENIDGSNTLGRYLEYERITDMNEWRLRALAQRGREQYLY